MSSKSAILSRPKSKVRRHFEDIELQNDNTHVMCKEGIVKRKTFIKVGRVVGAHGMRNHLKSAHSKAWLDLLKEEEAEKQSKLKNSKPAKKDQQTIDATFTKLDKINPQGQRQSDYDRALLELIVRR